MRGDLLKTTFRGILVRKCSDVGVLESIASFLPPSDRSRDIIGTYRVSRPHTEVALTSSARLMRQSQPSLSSEQEGFTGDVVVEPQHLTSTRSKHGRPGTMSNKGQSGPRPPLSFQSAAASQ